MSRHCQKCRKKVFFAEEREESGVVWHLFCFSCMICNKLLTTKEAVFLNNKLYCVDCVKKKEQEVSRRWEKVPAKLSKNLDDDVDKNPSKIQFSVRSRSAERKNKTLEDDQLALRPRTACCNNESDLRDSEKYENFPASPLGVLNYYNRQHSVNSAFENLSSGKRNEIDSSGSPPIYQAIELFDKPNVIETSLPRYQNKCPKATNENLCKSGDEKKIDPEKTEKLKEFFEKKFCSEDRPSKGYVIMNNVRNIETSKNLIERKIEKEKRNLGLKVNEDNIVRKENSRLGNAVLYHPSLKGKINNGEEKNDLKILENEMSNEEKELKFSLSKSSEISTNNINNQVYGGGWDCHRCGRRVYHAERMLACGNAYHNSCFSCVDCRKLLGPRTYLEADMEIYCSQCHAKRFKLTGYGYGMGPGVLQTL